MKRDAWTSGDAYEAFMGRWSRPVAARFVSWLGIGPGLRWLDVGCGTGALSGTVLASAEPGSVLGIDPSEAFVGAAAGRCADPRARFQVGGAGDLAVADGAVDVVVSGLVLNFVPAPAQALAEFLRVTAPGGTVAAYVWDYAEGMAMLRRFWTAAAELDPRAAELDEGARFPLCHPGALRDLWVGAGLAEVATEAITVGTTFAGFEDYWSPFLGGQGPAAAYVASLDEPGRAALRNRVRQAVDPGGGGELALTARAWAVRGTRG